LDNILLGLDAFHLIRAVNEEYDYSGWTNMEALRGGPNIPGLIERINAFLNTPVNRRRAEEIIDSISNPNGANVYFLRLISESYRDAGQLDQAGRVFLKAQAVAMRILNPHHKSRALYKIAEVYRQAGNLAEAERVAKQMAEPNVFLLINIAESYRRANLPIPRELLNEIKKFVLQNPWDLPLKNIADICIKGSVENWHNFQI
jgi:tetratricopeptide (TPR) repeat protein